MSDIKINIHKCEAPETGYWAEIPAMPGCVTCADTLDDLRKNLIEAAQCWGVMETQIALDKDNELRNGEGRRDCAVCGFLH